MNPSSNDSVVSPYVLSSIFTSRYHQHLNHLNDLAFNHTKLLQEMMEKRPFELADPSDQRKRSFPETESSKSDAQTNKRSRKQSNPQQLLRSDQELAKDENQLEPASHPPPPPPLPPPISLERLFETFQKEFFAASSLGVKRFLPASPTLLPIFPPHSMPPFPPFARLFHPNPNAYPPPFHFATAKKRRTKVKSSHASITHFCLAFRSRILASHRASHRNFLIRTRRIRMICLMTTRSKVHPINPPNKSTTNTLTKPWITTAFKSVVSSSSLRPRRLSSFLLFQRQC